MSTITPTAKLTIDDMIAELMKHGTILGHSTIKELESAEIGVDLFVQEDPVDKDSRLRQLGGVALSRGMTYSQLTAQLHRELITRLRDRLQSMKSDGGLGGRYSGLFGEIVTF